MSQLQDFDPDLELSLAEAAHRYGVSLRTLSQRVRVGQIPAHKVRGLRGLEWRVSLRDLEQFGLIATADAPLAHETLDPEIGLLRQHVHTLESKLAAERHRAALLDQRLGHALLECGRLRAALTRQAGTSDDDLRQAVPPQGSAVVKG